jgi:cytochrome c551/c552
MLHRLLIVLTVCALPAQVWAKPWDEMDYGPYFSMTVEAPTPKGNITQKGLVIQLDEDARVLFDTDLLRYSAGWTGGVINWKSVIYDGSHNSHPSIVGRQIFANPLAPGWANAEGSLVDDRFVGRDGRRFGPLAHEHARWKGLYLHGDQVVLNYTVGGVDVLELPSLRKDDGLLLFARDLQIGRSEKDLVLQVCQSPATEVRALDASTLKPTDLNGPAGKRLLALGDAKQNLPVVALAGGGEQLRWRNDEGQIRLVIPAAATPCRLRLFVGECNPGALAKVAGQTMVREQMADLTTLTKGGPPRWKETLETEGQLGKGEGAYVIDTITAPFDNPYKSWLRFGGFDFFPGGTRAAICTWNGDVWIVDGIDDDLAKLSWRRIATGMFQPLGLKIVDDVIYVGCRDQITRLHDLNGDGEIDHYENFNNDHQVTEHFHEFAMDLQRDPAGNFYYAKSARHAKDSLVPHHGTLIKVSPDGSTSEIVCNGFRAANGVGLGPNGELATSDQEGHWTPANRINLVRPDGFYGNLYSYHRSETPTDYDPPLCWLPKNYDRSPAEQLWVVSDRWGPLAGSLLSLSYGTGTVSLIPYETVDGVVQGGSIKLPLEFPTGAMRGRFNDRDGQLYICGLFGWSSNKTRPGGFYRVRYTGAPAHLPVGLNATQQGVRITFTEPLDRETAEDPSSYAIEQWGYRWTKNYGSKHYRVSDPKQQGQDRVEVAAAKLLDDGRTVLLAIDQMQPVMQMKIAYNLRDAKGVEFEGVIHNTINRLGAAGEGPIARSEHRGELPAELQKQLRPGLIAKFAQPEQAARESDVRTSRLAAVQVAVGEAPAVFLEPGPFTATLEGYLRSDLRGTYQFALAGQGSARLHINGKVVLDSSPALTSDLAKLPPATVSLASGYNQIALEVGSTNQGAATVRLLWSSSAFGFEPIPPEVLFHNGADVELVAQSQLRDGRALYARRACARCHGSPGVAAAAAYAMPEMNHAPPSLAGVGSRLEAGWVARWLLDPAALRNHTKMPRMFPENPSPAERQQAADIAAFLSTRIADEAPAPSDEAGSLRAGEVLYENLGCIGCHHFGPPQSKDPYGRTSLHNVGAKFQPGALESFLAKPHEHYRATRMPDFKLSAKERALLAAHLRKSAPGKPVEPPELAKADAERGRTLIEQRGCLNCHSLSDKPPTPPGKLIALGEPKPAGCLAADSAARKPAPDFGLTTDEREALLAFLPKGGPSLLRSVPVEASERYIAELRCATCHRRDGVHSRLPEISDEEGTQGFPPELIPHLTWAGDKLRTEWVEQLFAGELTERPRPWLKARMPAFPARAKDLAAGMAAGHGYPAKSPPRDAYDAKLAEVGHTLTLKTGGFNCLQCHAMGNKPAEAAFEHRGVNFADISGRCREDYYLRWMRDPLRIDAGTKMPKFSPDGRTTPVTEIMNGDANRQFEALWHYIRSLEAGRKQGAAGNAGR